MNAVFAAASFYLAVLNPRDIAHTKALQVGKRDHRPALITAFILLESGNAFSGVRHRK